MSPIDETLREFLVESHENLDFLERDLVRIESDPSDGPTLARIFRTIHTIKGTCGFLALPRLEAVAHAGEGLLCELRDGRLAWRPEITGAMLSLVDVIRGILRDLEAGHGEGTGDDAPLIATLNHLQSGGEAPAEAAEQGINPPGEEATPTAEALAAPEPFAAHDAHPARDAPTAEHVPAAASRQDENTASNVRVDVGLLDKLMNLVGELVLARNQILQHAGSRDDSALLATSQRLNLITTELQEGVMKTRMQPIGTIWGKFPRVVRDLAVACGKQVRVEMEGRGTELDRTIIEAIKDPLTHLVRNAVDHGIETPQARLAAGKPAEGRLRLRAYHESGQVNIEISDDGGGIDPARLARHAVERGVIGREQVARMSDRELLHLVFLPGFSTAEKVTSISGRGVGMDVVKTNIEKIGGTVDLQSRPGEGTILKVKIPLTLAIIPALIVTAGDDRYAIPQVNLLELVRLEGANARREIEMVDGTPIYRLRGQLLPVVDLGVALGLDAAIGLDPRYRDLASEGATFGELRTGHLQWLDRLRRLIDGREALNPEALGSERECPLGRWLHGAGRCLSGRPEHGRLERLHAEFHQEVRGVALRVRDGESTEAARALERLESSSEVLIEAIRAVEAMVAAAEAVNIVVLQADGRQFGLVVEGVSDTEEIVVKPLGKHLKGVGLFAGATIMGDGRVALILDVPGIAQRANLGAARSTRASVEADARHAEAEERESFLLFRVGGDHRMAIPMSMVARLEEIPPGAVELAGGREVIQYRDQIMSLVRLGEFLGPGGSYGGFDAAQVDETLSVIVYRDQGRGVGLIVDAILDVVEDAPKVRRGGGRPGMLGSAVIQGRVTDLIDVAGLIRMAGLEAGDDEAAAMAGVWGVRR